MSSSVALSDASNTECAPDAKNVRAIPRTPSFLTNLVLPVLLTLAFLRCLTLSEGDLLAEYCQKYSEERAISPLSVRAA